MAEIVTNDQILQLLFIIAPQFVTTDPVKLAAYNLLIDSLRCQVNTGVLGCCSVLIYANLLAHYLTLQNSQYLGIATSISEGSLSIGFSGGGNRSFYNTSPYGLAYLSLTGNYRVGLYVTGNSRWQYGPPCGC